VTASNGKSLTFVAERTSGCLGEGVVRWHGPAAAGLQAADLGPPPFTYDVVVELDGAPHRATARWPDDEIQGQEPGVLLEFEPSLPALP
jgi:hypothetical protein